MVAVALGGVADAHGLETVLWIVAALPLPAIALSFLLPRERGGVDARQREVPVAAGV